MPHDRVAAESVVIAIEVAAKSVAMACDMATDCGCRRAYLASLVEAIDTVIAERNVLAGIIGWPVQIKETVGSDAGGMDPQRSGTNRNDAGASRQANRRRA